MNNPDEENPTFSGLLKALNDNDLERFKSLASNSIPRNWCQMETSCGHTLLQEAISQQRKEIFDHLLLTLDKSDLAVPNSRRETALEYALHNANIEEDTIDEYCASELIKSSAFPRAKFKNANLLHLSIANGLFEITKLLLNSDFDVNVQDWSGNTILHKALSKSPNSYNDEIITTLLYYGADPSIESSTGCNAFELSVQRNQKSVQEILFNYIFDEYTSCKIHIDVLLKLARAKSPLFYEILKYDVKCVIDDLPDMTMRQLFKILLVIDLKYLEILVQRFSPIICKICTFKSMRHLFANNTVLDTLTWDFVRTGKFLTHPYINLEYQIICSGQALSRLGILIETNDKLKQVMINLITNLDGFDICRSITSLNKNDENSATQLLLYLIQYGLICDSSFLHMVYTAYGFCDLFKFLLRVELLEDPNYKHLCTKNIIVSLMCDGSLDVNTIVEFPDRFLDMESIPELADYFGHHKLRSFLARRHDRHKFCDDTMERIQNHARVPRLLEVARDVFRGYFWTQFGVKNVKEFLELLDRIPISRCYKKIIGFETKLYQKG